MVLTPPPWIGGTEIAAAAVIVVVLARLYFGSVLFAPRYTPLWNVLRKVAAPVVARVVLPRLPIPVSVETSVIRAEMVGTVDLTPVELAKRIDGERAVEIPLLTPLTADWDGNTEDGTFVWYHGSKPSWLPRWLRPYQIHVTCFRIGDRTRVCAHYEVNSYRPGSWVDFLTGGDSYSPGKGVQRTRRACDDAGINLTMTGVSSK